MLVDLLVDVATLIESTLTLEKVAVTLPNPPSTDKCSAGYVWGTQLFDSDVPTQARGEIVGCTFRRAYVINYRVDLCINTSIKERTTAQQLQEATEYYGAADTLYCALMSETVAGTLFDIIEDCAQINIQPLVLSEPTGDRVSFGGTIRVTDPCLEGS